MGPINVFLTVIVLVIVALSVELSVAVWKLITPISILFWAVVLICSIKSGIKSEGEDRRMAFSAPALFLPLYCFGVQSLYEIFNQMVGLEAVLGIVLMLPLCSCFIYVASYIIYWAATRIQDTAVSVLASYAGSIALTAWLCSIGI